MAQLRDTIVDGNLEVTNDISLKTNSKSIKGIHPDTGVAMSILGIHQYDDEDKTVATVVGYDGYVNENGDTHIYGKDIRHYVSSVDENYCPYYKAEDKIDFVVRTSGYVTNNGKNVLFTIPITKPVIGSPKARVYSDGGGLVLRQNDAGRPTDYSGYTHGSNGASKPVVYAKPTSYNIEPNYNSGFVVTAYFDVATNVINNSPIGIYWDGTIELYN